MPPTQGSEHPHLLLWYVSGDLPEAQRRETAAHVERCGTCRSEVEAIESILETVRAEDRAARESSRFARGWKEGPAATRGAHESAAPIRGAARTSTPRPGGAWGWGILAAGVAAGCLVGLVLGTIGKGAAPRPAAESLRALELVTFRPPVRDAGAAPELQQPGPWAIMVVLPFGAPEGRFEISVERQDGSRVEAAGTGQARAGAGALTIFLPAMEEPGPMTLVLSPESGAADPSPLRYPFSVRRP